MRRWRFPLCAIWATACTFELAPLETEGPSSGGAAGTSLGGGGMPTGGASGQGGATGGGPTGGASGGVGGDASIGGASGSGGGGGVEGPLIGNFALDYYWITAEEDFTGPKNTSLFDSSCVLIANVSAEFAKSLAQLGTGRLTTGAVLAFDGACSCPTTPCYVVADAQHPWGFGVQNKALVPYVSIAVDPKEIPYGKHLYVPGFDGVFVPGSQPWGGYVHNGCVSADDTGGTLAGKDLSWFVALKPHYLSLDAQLLLTGVLVYDGGTRCP